MGLCTTLLAPGSSEIDGACSRIDNGGYRQNRAICFTTLSSEQAMSKRSLFLAFLCCAVVLSSAWLALTPSRAGDDDKAELNKQLTALLEQRCETLKQRLEYVAALETQDQNRFHDRILAKDELLQAKLALATSRDERIALAKERVNNLREREDFIVARSQVGVGDKQTELVSRAARQQAEIDLLREQLGSGDQR